MGSRQVTNLTPALLLSYSEAALHNSEELLAEASLLCERSHMARAYFLAVACIEEAGKALLAFDSQNRNLSDPAVCTKLMTMMESHGTKISYMLATWAMSSKNQRDALIIAIDLITHLKHGREPSMYSDLRTAPDRAQKPSEVIRDIAARDSVRLAEHCLAYAQFHVAEKRPAKFSTAHDRLLTMKSAKFQELLNNEDFWWYYISRMEVGQPDVAEAVIGYERDYIKNGTLFSDGR